MPGRTGFTLVVSVRASALLQSLNPYCEVELVTYLGGEGRVVMKTDVVPQSENPTWPDTMKLPIVLGETRSLRIRIYENEGGGVIGTATIPCARLLLSEEHSIPLHPCGTLHLSCPLLPDSSLCFYLKLSARNLKKMDIIGYNDPYFVLSCVSPSGEKREVYKSEVLDNKEKPHWRPMMVLNEKVCGGNEDGDVEIEVFDDDLMGRDFVGAVKIAVIELVEGRRQLELKDANQQPSGILIVDAAGFIDSSKFITALRSPRPLRVSFAVDFSRSSLKYHSFRSHDYLTALTLLAAALLPLHDSSPVPLYAFGSRPRNSSASIPFWRADKEQIYDLDTLIRTYQRMINGELISVDRKTMSELLRTVKEGIEAEGGTEVYHVVVIITDGQIADLERCKEVAISMSFLPVSIVIIGVGEVADKEMNSLDSNSQLLESQLETARRDVISFGNFTKAQQKFDFLYDVLSSIPTQLSDYLFLPPSL